MSTRTYTYPSKLVLTINGKRSDSMQLKLDFDNLFKEKLKTAVELMKIQKAEKIEGNDWEIYMIHKSKM